MVENAFQNLFWSIKTTHSIFLIQKNILEGMGCATFKSNRPT